MPDSLDSTPSTQLVVWLLGIRGLERVWLASHGQYVWDGLPQNNLAWHGCKVDADPLHVSMRFCYS